jgi:hypothetical protein
METQYEDMAAQKAARRARALDMKASTVYFTASYVGGLPNVPTKSVGGLLYIWPRGVGIGKQHWNGDIDLKRGVSVEDIASVEVEDAGQVAKSKAGPVLAFGLLGLLAKGSQSQATIIVHRKDGEAAYFVVDGKSGTEIKGKVIPVLERIGIPLYTDSAPLNKKGSDIASELEHLGDLHDRRILSDDEFLAAKQKVISNG